SALARAAGDAECLLDWAAAGSVADRGGRSVTCRDGDPACDADGVADGACTFSAHLCLNVPGCPPAAAAPVHVKGRAGAALAAAVQGLVTGAEACTRDVPIRVPIGRRARRRVALRAQLRDPASGRIDRDRLRLLCERAGGHAAAGGRAVVVTTNFETGLLV